MTPTPTLTDRLRGNDNWPIEAENLAQRVSVAERERQALCDVVDGLRASDSTTGEILLFLAASMLGKPGGSPVIGALVTKATGVSHADQLRLTAVESTVETLLADLPVRRRAA